MSPKPEGAKSYIPFIIIGVVLVAVIVGVLLMSRADNANTAAQRNTTVNASAPAPAKEPPPGAPNPHVRGGANAPVTLEEFSDFQCPACGGLDPALRRIEKDYGDRVRLVFRNFPLQRAHKYAFLAARAAEAAGLQGKFWEMHDLLYDNQKEWSEAPEPRTVFEAYANRLGLDVARFKADMERQEVADRVVADYNRGLALDVRGTPTIFLNGRELPADRTLNETALRAEIDSALNAQGK